MDHIQLYWEGPWSRTRLRSCNSYDALAETSIQDQSPPKRESIRPPSYSAVYESPLGMLSKFVTSILLYLVQSSTQTSSWHLRKTPQRHNCSQSENGQWDGAQSHTCNYPDPRSKSESLRSTSGVWVATSMRLRVVLLKWLRIPTVRSLRGLTKMPESILSRWLLRTQRCWCDKVSSLSGSCLCCR